ncbi:MAG: acyltransferase [Variovorax sp.]|jgi:peptidoglycan/LPS O-acetylase OafA/YrhL|nr:MAG: acyltransferase [Variovorax sp.]
MTVRTRSIGASASLVLDMLRLGAALTVLFAHAQDMWLPSTTHDPLRPGEAAHSAIVVFFVLSGFVIAYTTNTRRRGLGEFLQARWSRLFSMVIPALILTAVVELAVRAQGDPGLMAEYVRGAFGPRYAVTGLFLNETWFFSAAPPANGALWSLSFEFWYYMIFGLWFCTGRGWRSWLLALAACAIAGPKILLMMPIWLMGCAAYLLPRPAVRTPVLWLGVALALGAAALVVARVPPFPYPIGTVPFFFANEFVTDTTAGLCVAVALWLLPSGQPAVHGGLVDRFRVLADLTFPIYVLHFPLLILWRVLFGLRVEDHGQYALALTSVLFVAAILGLALERQRPRWGRAFGRLFAWGERLRHGLRPRAT